MPTEIFTQDAEVALLSIIINNPELIYNVQNVKPFMFSASPHQTLWTIIQDMLKINQIPNKDLISIQLRAQNREDLVGGKDYLNYISKQTFKSENLVDYEKIIINNYKSKELVSIGNALPREVLTGGDADILISKVRQS